MKVLNRRGVIKDKIILLLLGGLVLGLKKSPKGYLKLIGDIHKEWKKIDQRALTRAIHSLNESKLIREKTNKDGTVTYVLSQQGREEALTYNLDKVIIQKHVWDQIWRIVLFDIPEKKKRVRESIRYHLKKLGFVELQRSVFVLPYKCHDEIDYLVEFYNAKKFVRYMEATHIDNEPYLLHKFALS